MILGVGVTPETRYIKEPQLLLKDKSLEVDEYYRVKGVHDAYAVGASSDNIIWNFIYSDSL